MSKILLIDDDQDLANLTKTTLIKQGYQASVLHSAEKIIEEIKVRRPDLILMDIMMPGVSGAEAVKRLKKDPDLKNIPVIFLTGLISSEEEDLEKSGINIEGVVYKTLGKPYEIDDLLKLVRKTLVKV